MENWAKVRPAASPAVKSCGVFAITHVKIRVLYAPAVILDLPRAGELS